MPQDPIAPQPGIGPTCMNHMQIGKLLYNALPGWPRSAPAPARPHVAMPKVPKLPRLPLAQIEATPMAKGGGVVADLLAAKAESDRKNYAGKHRIMRKLLRDRPHEFFVDSTQGAFLGISHSPSGFKMHLPRKLVPAARLGQAKAAVSPVVLGMIASRRPSRPLRKAVRPKPKPILPAPEPSPEETMESAVQAVRAIRTRRNRKMAGWDAVPASVALRVQLGAVASPIDGDPLSDPAVMINKLATAALSLPDTLPHLDVMEPVEYALPERLQKRADGIMPGHDLFTPSIPVDAFNNAVWTDAWQNPFGSRSTFGDNSQQMRTSPQVAAAVSGLVSGAGAARNTSHVSPWDVALAAGTAAGKGWLGGLVLGKTVGTLAGMSPEAQKGLQDVGLWGGLLTGAVNSVFGR
jgi:hypothetical protein